MQRIRQGRIVAGALLFLVWFVLLSIACVQSGVVSAQASRSVVEAVFIAPTASATASSSSGNGGGLDPAIIAAFIGLGGGIIVALVGGGFGIYQMRRTIQAQREQLQAQKQAKEKQIQSQKQSQEEQLRVQHQQAQEMQRLKQERQEQAKAKERERQSKEATLEAARLQMVLAENTAEQVKAYRKALHADPRISRLQILDMSRPLEVTSVYIRVRVHEEARLLYEIDPLLREAEERRDPNVMIQASRKYLERRVGTALHPDEALRKYQRCVIVGDPGAGKTTLLKFLALSAADGTLKDLPDLPIHIELNAFAAQSTEHDLLYFAAAQWDERYAFHKEDARAYMDTVLEEGKALLLLDALDETVIGELSADAENSYRRASEAILGVTTRYPQSPIVVTARKAGYQQRMSLTGFTELEVVDFRPEDIEQFVNKWFACFHDPHKEAAAVELNSKLQKNARIRALAANPLLLSLIVLLYEAQLDLPDRRAELYKECVDVLLSEWDAKRNIRRRREFKPEHKRQLLAELAWHFHSQGLRYFPKQELQAEIARFLPAVGLKAEQYDDVLQEITNENGLLKEQAHGWYGFLHLTLQEYFVAHYVSDHGELATLLQHIGDPWWEEVLLLYAGQTPDASPLLQTLLGQSDQQASPEDLFATNLVTAGRCLAAHPTVRQVSLREEVITRLFDQLTTTPYTLSMTQSAEALAEIGGTAVNARLIKLLSDTRLGGNVRGRIADALGQLGEREVVPELVKLLSGTRLEEDVRGRIVAALGQLEEREVVPELVKLLSDTRLEEDVRGRIVAALGQLANDEETIRALFDLVQITDIKDAIYTALWHASRRMNVRIIVKDKGGAVGKAVELLKW